MNSTFVPDPSWPTILDLATKLWGEPTDWSHDRNEARFGTRGSKRVKLKEMVWVDEEGGSGGYKALHEKAIGPLPNGDDKTGPEPWHNVAIAYDYRNGDGVLIAQNCRMKPGYRLRFMQRRPSGKLRKNGEPVWKWSTKGLDIPLYRTPEMYRADPLAVHWLCEGEKDCDRLAAAGLIATTNIAGAAHWNADRHNVDFAGRHVVILEDNDDAGRKRSARIAPGLIGIASSVKVLALPGLPPKGDVSDWLDAGGTVEELERFAREAPEYRKQTSTPDPADHELPQIPWIPEQTLPGAEPEPDGEAEPEGTAQPEAGRELCGPPTLDDLDIADLAALDELVYGRIAKDKAALLDTTPTVLTKLVDRARAAPKAEAKAAEKAAKAKAEADAKMAKAQARLREKEAKEKERATKAAEARTRLAAQKTPLPLANDDDDPLRDWIPPDPDTLPEIIVAGGERPAIADAALAAMKGAGVPFYQRGKDLVRICLIKLKQSNGKMVRVPAISTVTKPMLLRAMGLCAKWLALNKELDLVQIDPPSDLGDHILGMIGEWPFPPLRGVIATQTMRYDGTLLTKPGYDAATGLVLFNPPPMPEIPDQPTKQDALEALALLNGLLAEVKFAEDNNVSRSGAISMLMTPVLRGMMSVVPLHIVNKPAPGTGGSYMQDIMAAISIGEPCPVLSLTLNNDEENEKRLSSAAISGQPIIAIDNMVGTLMGQFLCQLVERPMPQIRILGKTELVTIPNNHTTVANGNNVAIAADMVRRTLQISLDADEENPESRTFTRNPVAEVLADRGRYIAAILTIARAYRVAGMPGKLPQRLSFGEWSDNVRSALKWLGWPDCDDSIKTVRAADPAGVQLHAVITAWATDLTVSVGYRTSELIKEAAAFVYDGPSGGARAKPDLWDALFYVAGGKNGQLDARALGRWLEASLNRVSGGYKLLVDRSDTSRPRWRLEPR